MGLILVVIMWSILIFVGLFFFICVVFRDRNCGGFGMVWILMIMFVVLFLVGWLRLCVMILNLIGFNVVKGWVRVIKFLIGFRLIIFLVFFLIIEYF